MRFHKLEEQLLNDDAAIAATLLSNSQKFYAGNIDRLPNASDIFSSHSSDNFPRLPYHACAIEFEWRIHPHNVIVLCEENEQSVNLFTFLRFSGSRAFGYIGRATFNRNLLFWSYDVDGSSFALNLVDQLFYDTTGKMNNQDAKNVCAACCAVVARFLSVLNCVHIPTQTIDAPARLNKKRVMLGKRPLYSYKVLVLKPTAVRLATQGGTHDSPAIHLRRGHIKHRKTGDFWWQSHIVGDRKRGIVVKDYRADKLIHALSEP
jgi:hypothetical protein